jgi:phosphate transport system permease protein
VLLALCAAAGLIVVFVLAEIVYQVVHGATPAISQYGLGFLGRTAWEPNFNTFGAAAAIYGTVMTSLISLLIAVPLAVAIGLYLSMMAPRSIRAVVGPLVEMLAAIPSVIVGFWGVIVLAPFLSAHLEGFLHRVLGFIPLFGATQISGLSMFTAGVGLTVMVLPIIAALSRDLFLTVPRELTDGAAALGATRWEVMRGIVLPSTASGVAAAVVLALGRALGEAIAVTQMVGDGIGVHANLFLPGNTLSSRIANDFPSPEAHMEIPSLFYLGLILLALGLLSSVASRSIAARFDVRSRLVAG